MTQSEQATLAVLVAVVERMDREATEDRAQRRDAERLAAEARERATAAAAEIATRVARLEDKVDRETSGQVRLQKGVDENTKAVTAASAAEEARADVGRSTKATITTIVAVAGFSASILGNLAVQLVQSAQ